MTLGLLGLLLACGEKETNEDTVAEPSAEDTGAEDVEDTDDTEDTGETDTPDTGDTDTEEPELNTDFPELLPGFMDRFDNAYPLPMSPDEVDNTTVMTLMMMGFSPVFEIQMVMDFAEQSGTTVTCPMIQGEFPEDGLPTEDVVVTGNGCRTDDGVLYDGSFVYNGDGVRYSDYVVSQPNATCLGLNTVATYNGGIDINMSMDLNMEKLDCFSGTEVNEQDCLEIGNDFAFHSNVQLTFGDNSEQTINGHADIVAAVENTDYFMTIDTVDEVIDESLCQSEPVSGTNTLSNGNDEAVFTFDGATDCDTEPTQMLSFNGGAAAEVTGASCSTSDNPASFAWLAGVIGLLFYRRRQ